MSGETVKFRVEIDIQAQADIDSELTLDEWNALLDDERAEIIQDARDVMLQADNGGCWVITEGATEA